MSEYVPNADDVRESYAIAQPRKHMRQSRAEFDRWLAAHDAEVAEKALREYAEAAGENESIDNWTAAEVRQDVEAWISDGIACEAVTR
ncbi:DNA -binding domain-containing protein [Occultella gossypii]|uniref:Uncharacterized protein n=1 Tax=Occultella gossypii TaxID=2800820 RepID=A0ABS7SA93_9MICO|nr:DUF2285 domain-containing protein [Occultella gossypii]MBZ2197252.1 hypothetical protein [Occultella gossypii]